MEIDIDIAELAPTMKSDFLEHWTVIIIKPLGHPCPRLGDLTDDLSGLRTRTDWQASIVPHWSTKQHCLNHQELGRRE